MAANRALLFFRMAAMTVMYAPVIVTQHLLKFVKLKVAAVHEVRILAVFLETVHLYLTEIVIAMGMSTMPAARAADL
jgi:hypothetical protein